MHNRPFVTFAALPVRHRGLTLIELLVAITVLAFVAVLGWRGLDSIVRTRIALTTELEQTRGMQIAFAQLQSDCAHIADAVLIQNRPLIFIEQGRLKLVRTVFSESQPSRLQVVSYQLRDGKLTRHESAETRDLAELDLLWLNTTEATKLAQEVVLQSGVAAFDMRLWINGGWRTGEEALKLSTASAPILNPPSGQATQLTLPNGLEIKIQLIGRDTNLLKIFLLGVV